ncbi:unnamed protein product [Nezara viridula]|uniref:Uncharacterized protein n=1 Tax=Nezara viridula TaxID=85310 RepID=A0A9P0MRY3_NEZVI|nr:unnamed protein product [Nezara viridula]
MGRLVRSRTKVQKPDAENIPPSGNIKKPRRGKVASENLGKVDNNIVHKAVPGPSSGNAGAEDKKPIYSAQKKSLTRRSLKGIEERLHMYDFEVDENEPVVKKTKRKPNPKVKKQRTYKKKFKFLPESSIILDVGKENVHPVNKAVTPSKKTATPKKSVSIPLAEISNIPADDNIDLSIDAAVQSKRLTLYSPPPYRSPKRDSLNVPIVRASCSKVLENITSRSLNVSNKHDKSDCSTYSGSFMNQLFMGSSTPIRSHWAEDSAPYVTPKPATQYGNFHLSNNFGLEADEGIEEPFVSPIKSARTPSHSSFNKTPVKQSPVKVPFEQVVKILKFGADAPEDSDLSFEGLPDNFYHDGDTPTYSPLPSTPERPVKHQKECLTSTRKVKHVQFQEESDDSGLTQSSEDKNTLSKFDIVYNNRKNLKKSKQEKDKDVGYETEDQIPTKRPARRSYERPVYLRTKKKVTPYGAIDTVEDDDHEETISKKTTKKKNCGHTKKEALEMEKWAKAFNEQCMQIENFNLCVE